MLLRNTRTQLFRVLPPNLKIYPHPQDPTTPNLRAEAPLLSGSDVTAMELRGSILPMAVLLMIAALTPWLAPSEAAYIAYNTTPGIVPGKINVHLVPHSHDDVGWLKTIDQYFVGSNNSIQFACVQNVLDSVVEALQADENRRFVFAEQAFFQRWWRQQSAKTKNVTKKLVSSGQLELINGGMCMHDEATTHYIDMIDQTTLGHRFIKKEFDQTPRIGWQIDPFGHSAVQAYLLGAEVGFDALYFSRIDYQDRRKRKDLKTLEVIWRASKTFGSSSEIFTGIFPENYEPPSGFYFEVNDNSDLVQDDIDLFDYNVHGRVNDFVTAAVVQANITRTNHIMWTMGTDFKYQYATTWFRQLDKLIHYVNMDGRINALYSSPSLYTDAKYAANETWPLKMEDFFPYADRINAYWTGYFTSRPGLKGYVRTLSAYYLAARQLEYLRGHKILGPTTDALADALAITQHHDAVTGTEKQHVADDYAKRLSIGYNEAEKLVGLTLGCLSESTSGRGCEKTTTSFRQCPLINITYCPPSEQGTSKKKKSLVVVIYNSLGWRRQDVIRIPVVDEHLGVLDFEGKEVEAQLLPITEESLKLRNIYVKAYLGMTPTSAPKFWLVFPVSVPPLGFSTYFVTNENNEESKLVPSIVHSFQNQVGEIEIGQGNLKLSYDSNGRLINYNNLRSMVKDTLRQSYGYYSASSEWEQSSGAYIFRPDKTFPMEPSRKVFSTFVQGPIVDEVYQSYSSWIYQVTRVYKAKEHVEFEYIVGPIPTDDYIGKEVIANISTSMLSNGTFFTDSNGRDFIKRIRNYRRDWNLEVNQPISGNYYPINLGIYIEDNNKELSILVDRSVGGASILDGQIELMLHRRLLNDDSRGVAESLEENVCLPEGCSGLTIQGKFFLRMDSLGEGAKWRRAMGQKIYSPLLLAFSEQDRDTWIKSHLSTFTAIEPNYTLPDNVALITLQALEDGDVLLRLAHLYEVGENKDLSVIATVELKKLFPDKKICKVKEMNLSANQEREEMEKKKLKWRTEGPANEEKIQRGGPVDSSKLLVELSPMEIRTFVMKFEENA